LLLPGYYFHHPCRHVYHITRQDRRRNQKEKEKKERTEKQPIKAKSKKEGT
jgi:hypothetical protein